MIGFDSHIDINIVSASRLFFLFQVTVVSVASPTSNTSQKSVTLPVNVALGQQILTVQQPTSLSPVKVATSQTTAQVRRESVYWSVIAIIMICFQQFCKPKTLI